MFEVRKAGKNSDGKKRKGNEKRQYKWKKKTLPAHQLEDHWGEKEIGPSPEKLKRISMGENGETKVGGKEKKAIRGLCLPIRG